MPLYKSLWERFLLYLPMMVMGLLALGTYWLVRSTPSATGPLVTRPVSHEPDYFMNGFAIRTFDATGRMRTEVLGEKARHYPNSTWLEIDAIQIRSYDAQGRVTTASAQRGLTKEDSSEVQLMGNAVVLREADVGKKGGADPRMEYRGEYLHASMKDEKVRSDKPVELTRGKDRFTADALEFDNTQQVLLLRGRVRGTLVPQSR